MLRILLALFASTLLTGCYTKSSVYLFNLGDGPEEVYHDSVAFTRVARLIIMPVTINGETYRFLYDTGAPMVVSPELAEKLNMKRVARKHVNDSQGKREKLDYVRINNFTLGNKTFNNLTAIVADLKRAPAINCLDIDGIIGANMMRFAIWEIDFVKEVLYFTNDFTGFTPDSLAHVLPFKTKATGTPVVTLVIDGDTLTDITFDTGSAGALSVYKRRLKKGKVEAEKVSYGYHSQGLFGSTADTNYLLHGSIGFGESVLPLAVLTLETTRAKDLLGQRFFQDYRVVLNWQEKKAYLTPIKQPGPVSTLAISPHFVGDKIYVGTLTFGSLADSLGVKPGDEIVQINDMNLETAAIEDYCKLLDLWRSDDPEITVTVKGMEPFVLREELLFAE